MGQMSPAATSNRESLVETILRQQQSCKTKGILEHVAACGAGPRFFFLSYNRLTPTQRHQEPEAQDLIVSIEEAGL